MKIESIIRLILNERYRLKNSRIPKRKWRALIAGEYCKRKLGNADDFISAWEKLEKEGLIK